MPRKLGMIKEGTNPALDELSSDGAGIEFGQPLSNQSVPTGYPTLPNPVHEAPFDRKKDPDCDVRQEAFGFETRPRNFNDLEVGNAGAGNSYFRRAQFYSRIIGPAGADRFDLNIYNNPIAIATARSPDIRPRFWHISFFAVSAVASGAALTESEILNVAGTVPTNTVLRGRVQVYDESGSRFFDTNIHGTESFQFYGWGVTTFILLPTLADGTEIGVEVDAFNPGSTPLIAGTNENTLATGRIVPIFQNATQITDNVTRTVSVPSPGSGVIPIPPGARQVRIRANVIGAPPAVSAAYEINFAGLPVTGRPPALGRINLLPGTLETGLVAVPNATFIVFDAPAVDPALQWIATFVVEA